MVYQSQPRNPQREPPRTLLDLRVLLRLNARKARRLAFFGDSTTGTPGLAALAGRVRDHVASIPGCKNSVSYKQIQKLAQKISNYRPHKGAVVPARGATAEKKMSQSERIYGSLVQAGPDFAPDVAQVPGYNPPRTTSNRPTLVLAMKALADKNHTVVVARIAA